MRLPGLVVVAMVLAPLAVLAKPVPVGPVKAYTGPEGEVIVLVAANDGKDMLVHFRNIGAELDGKTLLYRIEDLGEDRKTVYVDKRRGSKTFRSIMLTYDGHGSWRFTNPVKPSTHFKIRYADEESRHIKLDDVLNAYKP